jgi:hypothetical protein
MILKASYFELQWDRGTVTACILFTVKGKGKAIPLQAWAGPEGSRRLWLPVFKTVGT